VTDAPIEVEAVVLRTIPYGDSDLVVHLFARGRGKLAAFARTARKSAKRFGGGLEPFAVLSAELHERRGRDLLDLRTATLLEGHFRLRTDLSRLAHAGYATELVRELLRDHEPNDPLFEGLVTFYDHLTREEPRSVTLRAFELLALDASGLAPVLDRCARCGRDLDADGRFDPGVGGAACRACSTNSSIPLDRAAVRLLSALRDGGLAAATRADERDLPLDGARQALRIFIDHHVHHDLRSVAFLRDVGAPP
jgi:DNA repair protein RecO (recombination protein O)